MPKRVKKLDTLWSLLILSGLSDGSGVYKEYHSGHHLETEIEVTDYLLLIPCMTTTSVPVMINEVQKKTAAMAATPR